MPTKNPKRYRLTWKETKLFSAVVETEWTPEEIVAHALSVEYSEEEETKPVWQELLDMQVVDPSEHVLEHEMEFISAEPAVAADTRAEHLPLDRKLELIDRLRNLTYQRRGNAELFDQMQKIFDECGLSPVEPGEWGVIDCWGTWACYQVTEEMARQYWAEHEGSWRLCAGVVAEEHGDHYITIEERGDNTPRSL